MEKYIKAAFVGKNYMSKPYHWVVGKGSKHLDGIKVGDLILVESTKIGTDIEVQAKVKVLEIFESDEPPYKGKIKRVIKKVFNVRKKIAKYKGQWESGKGSLPKKIIHKINSNQKELNFNNVLNFVSEYYFYKALVKAVDIELPDKENKGTVIFTF
ncbi:MAG: hypothetical protein LBV08_02980 [Clostridiales bacterium]|jgi:hypothetical protein|nr:hypothetical protein [Clostridiales bacterium]